MAVLNECFHIVAEVDAVAGLQPLGVADECLPAAQVDTLVQRRADGRAVAVARAGAFQSRRNDAGVVEHQHIARLQQVGQVGNAAVFRAIGAVQHQHPCGIARHDGAQRDAFGRQLEIEQIYAHEKGRRPYSAMGAASSSIDTPSNLGARCSAVGSGRLSAAMEACTMRVGSVGGSPRVMASTPSMPEITRPKLV